MVVLRVRKERMMMEAMMRTERVVGRRETVMIWLMLEKKRVMEMVIIMIIMVVIMSWAIPILL